MRAILQLPLYLECVKASRSDDPASLMGLLNDLRAVRGEHLFTETQLFAPDMRAARQATGPRVRFDDAKFHDVMKKLRHMYESVMVSIMRDRNYDEHLPALKKVFENFSKVCQGTVKAPLWDVGLALVEGIENDTIPGSVALNNLLRDMDKEIRHMSSVGVVSLDEYAPEELIKNLLYYIARSQATSPKILSMRELYRLDRALPGMQAGGDDVSFGSLDPEAMRSVVVALSEEFHRVKEIFDHYVNGGESNNDALVGAIAVFKQAGDTLAVLGLADMRKKMEQLISNLRTQIDSGVLASSETLMEAASRLLEIEVGLNEKFNRDNQLAGDGAPVSMDYAVLSANETVIHECHNGLEQVKDAIVDYIASQWDGSHLKSLPELLQAVRGGLEIVGQRRAARVLGACGRYIKEQLIAGDNKPDFKSMDALADAIASVEYYLECLDDDVIEDQDETLAVAETSVASLGYAVAVYQRVQQAYIEEAPEIETIDSVVPVLDQQVERVEPATEDIPVLLEEPPVSMEPVSHDGPLLSEEELLEFDSAPSVPLILDGHENAHHELFQQEEPEAVSVAETLEIVQDVEDVQEAEVAVEVVELDAPVETAVPVVAAAAEKSVVELKPEYIDAPLLVEDYDEEIAEIFIEEATEVLEAIREFYPKWRENFADQGSLTEFRRAFHTLKGSGRMAHAIELGELAWSVENMLNRIIDGTIVPGEELCVIIDRVVEKIPSMIEAFSQRKMDPQPALSQRLADAATAVASGRPMTSLEVPASAGEEVAAPPVLEAAAVEFVEVEPVAAVVAEPEDMDEDFDPVLWEIFASEAETHLEVADEWLAYARERSPIAVETTDPLQRALHTLKGSAHMAEVTPIAELATPFEKLVKELRAYQIKVGDDFIDLFAEVVDEIRYGLHLIENHKRVVLPHCESLLVRTAALRAGLTGGGEIEATSKAEAPVLATVDPTRFNNFLVNEMDALMDVAPSLAQWADQQEGSGLDRIVFELNEMAVGAEEAGIPSIASLARSIVPGYVHARSSGSAFAAWTPLALEAHNAIIDFMDRLAASEDLVANEELEQKIAAYCATEFSDAEESVAAEVTVSEEVPMLEEAQPVEMAVEEIIVPPLVSVTVSSADEDAAMLAELDPEMLDIFLEEADELLEELEGVIHQWSEDTGVSMADDVRRTLHTFKGGARMSGLMLLGTLAHDLETQLECFSGEADAALINTLHDCQDKLFRGVAMVKAWRAGDASLLNFSSLLSEEAALQVDVPEVSAEVIEPEVIEPIVEVAEVAEIIEEPEFEEVVFPEDLVAVEEAVAESEMALVNDAVGAEVLEAAAVSEAPVAATVAGGILEYSEDIDSELLDIFLEEADELVEELEQLIADWQAAADDNSFADALRRNLHTLKGGARMSGLMGLGLLAHDLETQLEQFVGPADQALFAQILQYQDAILAGVTQGRAIAAGQAPQPMSVAMPGTAVAEPVAIEPEITATQYVEPEVVEPEIVEPEIVELEVVELETVAPEVAEVIAVAESAADSAMAELGISEDADPEMFSLFLEEANELLEDLETQIQSWHEAPDDSSFCDALKRNLHTLKGGARMTGIMGLGNLAHDLETQLEQFSGVADAALFATMHSYYDKMMAGVNLVRRIVAGDFVAAATAAVPEIVDHEVVITSETVAAPVVEEITKVAQADIANPVPSATIIPFRGGSMPRGLEEAIAGKKGSHAAIDAKAAQAQQEMIKVSADLLENLVNLAGETSISRSRVEQQMIDIERTAEEMESTILRLQDQLRRLESETDAQIQSRQAEIQERSDDFDPLEMDRYSTVQQLTSSLSESASDLLDIRNSLNNKLRDTETLLVQQARINTGLQEGLMRSRMVPFSRLEPRLRRIIRQVSSELKKDVAFDLENVQGELDRTMLERMVAPLEHMLRNACDHGIETPEKRLAAGKSKQGRVVLSLGRDGGDILISLRDDGGGINVDAVRKKAIERGLLTADSPITDSEALQFILQAGFSTAEKVTQISGRGVGMDVVHSEIKAMGGSMTIHSAVGQGTEFIVRLPFTVSVNRALMVRIGEDTFAIPLTSIEGIVRVSPYELESYYEDPEARFEYAGRYYEVRYLGAMLQTKMRANFDSAVMPEPVILLRSAEHTVALHVDQLIGSREIVVKALGMQFASVPGLSGATLLGDGSVVVILDLLALVRANLALEGAAFHLQNQAVATTPAAEESITVMVCDDSVTVRKVTSRLLEREGFNVMLAKDGADALLQMQDRMPDVLLLDIEMPRMDGFEVASTIKNSQRLQDIPIIMITSRTGEKHRERAMGMG
ncbi:MAG TPA: Hpt domain-containing protein, partial [Pseudomonadales bacterium]|nr:Hpt domain-containing protein [Pseudomonadales bacterium]